MIVSGGIILIICVVILVGISFPGIRLIIKNKDDQENAKKTALKALPFFFAAIVITAIVGINTPIITTITDCGEYKEQKMLFPKKGFSYGDCEYIINNSSYNLLLAHIAYGDVNPATIDENVIIKSGETYRVKEKVDYHFSTPPESVRTKSSTGVVYKVLVCLKSN